MNKTTPSDTKQLTLTSWFNVIIHIVGLIMILAGMRQGTPLLPLEDRMAYLSTYPLGWSIGWVTWMICAIALIAFCSTLASYIPERADMARLAVILASAGAAVDLLCDALLITVLPMIASWGRDFGPLFLAFERTTGAGGMIVANGLYSISILILTLCLIHRSGRVVIGLGLGVFLSGMIMVVAGFTGVPRHLELATGPTIGLFCAWTISVARSIASQRSNS
jgi:hypothetical protein